MSDDWKFFMCAMGDNLASIMVDVGIAESIERTPGRYCVFLYHLGVTRQTNVSNHTIALRRKAEEFGGEYDGWGAEVVGAGG